MLGLPFSLSGFLIAIAFVAVGHELGHLLVAKLVGIPVRLIAIGLGPILWRQTLPDGTRVEVKAVPVGMAVGVMGRRTNDGRVRRPWQHDMAMAAGGPLANFLLVVALLALAYCTRTSPGLEGWFVATAILSVILALFNLIPLPGLDGGHLLVLSAARMGAQLSPRGEARLHRVGLRLTAAACVALLAVRATGVA